ncbi:MAG: hypothetical protein J0I65_20535 [Variovorax sp.]|nr:hypothetical protein [Variovorax sp.]
MRSEECQFIGDTSNRNRQGGIGTYGEATFINCKVKWFALTGDTKLVLRGCECEDVRVTLSGENLSASVLVESSKLRGEFRMIPARLQSLTIRDTQIDLLDLTGASVKGDVVMDRVKGGYFRLGVKEGAGNFVLKDSQLYTGSSKVNETSYAYAGGFKSVLIENTDFTTDLLDKAVIAGGFDPDVKTPQPVLTQSYILRKSRVPILDASYLNAGQVVLEGNEIGSLDLSNSRIGQLEVSGNTISRGVDFSQTQVKQANVQLRRSDQVKLEGSNIKLPK